MIILDELHAFSPGVELVSAKPVSNEVQNLFAELLSAAEADPKEEAAVRVGLSNLPASSEAGGGNGDADGRSQEDPRREDRGCRTEEEGTLLPVGNRLSRRYAVSDNTTFVPCFVSKCLRMIAFQEHEQRARFHLCRRPD